MSIENTDKPKNTDDELKAFMEALDTPDPESYSQNMDEPMKELPAITEEEFEQKLMSGVAMLLDSCNEVAHNLKLRIKNGDNYEGTMMGFAQATDNTIKGLKILENRRNLRIREEIKHREMEKQHENRKELEAIKNEGRAKANVQNLTQNNTFIGDPSEFLKQIKKIESGQVVEVESETKD